METLQLKEGAAAKIAENPREKALIDLRKKLQDSINNTELTLELDKDLLLIICKKLEKFK